MAFDLAAMARRARNIRRKRIVLPDIRPPAVLATDLYRSCYLPVIEAWLAAQDRILAEYERTLAEMTTDSPADLDKTLTGVASELLAIILTLTPRLRNWTMRVERWHRGRWRRAILSATSVDLTTMLGPDTARRSLEQTIAWNTSLIRDVSDQTRQRIGNIVYSGLTERKPAREVRDEIKAAVDMARGRALRIASDQMAKLAAELQDERRREAGIERWQWRHSGKLHPREEHLARNGKVYTDETAPQDLPGRLPWCGCRSQAVLDFE